MFLCWPARTRRAQARGNGAPVPSTHMAYPMLFVTQVSPYGTRRESASPAGVHGVLEQAAAALAQIGELCDLATTRVADVRGLSPDDLGPASVLALFTIGETPWSDEQRRVILERLRAGSLAVVAIHSATAACYGPPRAHTPARGTASRA